MDGASKLLYISFRLENVKAHLPPQLNRSNWKAFTATTAAAKHLLHARKIIMQFSQFRTSIFHWVLFEMWTFSSFRNTQRRCVCVWMLHYRLPCAQSVLGWVQCNASSLLFIFNLFIACPEMQTFTARTKRTKQQKINEEMRTDNGAGGG